MIKSSYLVKNTFYNSYWYLCEEIEEWLFANIGDGFYTWESPPLNYKWFISTNGFGNYFLNFIDDNDAMMYKLSTL